MAKLTPRVKKHIDSRKAGELSVALFLFAFIALAPPLITLIKGDVTVFGLPLVFFYLFTVWTGIIVAARIIVARSEPPAEDAQRPER